MTEQFETETHFKTYSLERDPSFSANTNALLALLHQTDAYRFSSQILKAAKFLCDFWWKSDDKISDKWVRIAKPDFPALRAEQLYRTYATFIRQCSWSRPS